ncbi:zona pellucida protein AX 4 [Colossoma macropomum]|uniref:zona pellucida protein AX 4 n=1 Tax=Colossoma macropomum TaxID=42526 RepID=UPI0018652A4D|nr:zona pellucida protein AX 4 [Colossoma macropomum]
MAFGFYSGWLLLLTVACALCDPKHLPQYALVPDVDFETECRDRYFFVSVKMPSPGSELQFQAFDAGGAYPITAQHGEFCGYTVQAVFDRIVLRASYFSCHTDNQNDEVFSFKFKLIIVNPKGRETSAIISKTCSLTLPWSPREVLCEENYMEGSVVSGWQIMFEKEGQHSEVMSAEKAAALGYFLMSTTGRIVFRAAFGRPCTAIKVANGVSIHELHSVVLFRQKSTVMKTDLDVACVLSSSSGAQILWETPMKTPLLMKSDFEDKLTSYRVTGQLLEKQTIMSRGHAMPGSTGTLGTGIPYVSSEEFRKNLLENQYYHQNSFMDTGVKVVAPHPLPLNLLTVNQTVPKERIFTVYLGNIPLDVVLEAVELNGNYFPAWAASQRGYISEITYSNGTHAYSVKVQFEDPVVEMIYITEGVFKYSLSIKYILIFMPQGQLYHHSVSVVAYAHDVLPPAFSSQCDVNGISFKLDHKKFNYIWEFTIGPYPLTQQLADSQGYIMINDSRSLVMHAPLFTTGYLYENITLQQFFGTFEILTRNAKTLEVAQSSARRCLFKTTELLVCSTDGVMTVVSDVTKAVPRADPARATLLDRNCKPRDFDETKVLFSFGLNTCGTRVKINKQYIMYENEILFPMVYSSEIKPVITRDAAYKITVRCMYSVHGTSRLFIKRKFKAEAPAMTVPVDHKAKAPVKG